MSNLSVFAFEGLAVRFIGTAEQPEWIAADVCKVLDLKNVSQALDALEDDEKGVCIADTPGGKQELLTVLEPGLYRLIFKSRKEVAKRFQRWVFHEVLPQVRKTGSYSVQLDLAREQNRLLDKVHFLESVSPGLAPLALGKADQIVERVVEIERHVKVNDRGQPIDQIAGQSRTTVAKSLGMKKPAELIAWLQSIGRLDLVQPGFAVVPFDYVPQENLKELRQLWGRRQGNRQKLIGEG